MNSYQHSQYAHCESGVISSLLIHHGLAMSEPMVFGITCTLSFIYLPIIKLNNMPLISYRGVPRNIVKTLPKKLNLSMVSKKYNDPQIANNELSKLILEGKIVGLQTSVFHLPYFPKDMRFHFNAHNLIVCDKKENNYLISDPVFEEQHWCEENALTKARFAKGVFAPKGYLYYIDSIPSDISLETAIKKAIVKNAKKMLTPFPYAGIKGMRKLAQQIATLDTNQNQRYTINYLSHIVRMQEEIGTGGGGFRYLYAAFLEEAKNYSGMNSNKLEHAAELLTQSGDKLREFALLCVQKCKNTQAIQSEKIANALINISKTEEAAFRLLKKI